MKILMSAAGSAAAVSFIDHIKSLGHQVIGIDANPYAQEIAKNHCDKFILCPLATDKTFVSFLESINNEFDIYLPFIDEELLVITSSDKISEALKNKIVISPDETIQCCSSKINFQNTCEELLLPIAEITRELPAIYKPEFGRGGRGVTAISSNKQLSYYLAEPGIVQKQISGIEYTVDVLTSSSGGWVFGLARKRLQTSGVSTIGEIDCHPVVMDLAKRCVEKFSFRYCVNIQIMLGKDGIAHLIEINPRLAGSSVFSIYAGFDIIALTLDLFTGKEVTPPKQAEIKSIKVIRYWQEYVC